ncbi:flagellar hook-length control protein FliK [Devosia epidermidihirudinis]|uniref:flagellar hook-length control protein FliK n=1 Tax=Devosia epidermidihirudinis TaxID=1293439 RepID=UPI00069674E1|nr:flagellar hook-length control protein FliK [Devosia epidermidihirudinis]
MASHLTVTVSSAAGFVSKGLNGQASADPRRGNDFANLLSASNAAPPSPRSSEARKSDVSNDSSGSERREDPEAVAAPVEARAPIQNQFDPQAEMADLVANLSQLKSALDAGQPIDPELLKRIDAALQNLASALNIDLSDVPSLDNLKNLLASVPDDGSFGDQLNKALGPLAEGMRNGQAVTDGDNADLLKSVGDKLAALLKAVNSNQTQELDGLGEDEALKAALAKLALPATKIETAATAQPLATPELKLTEPVLAGKTAETAPAAAPLEAKPSLAPRSDSARKDTTGDDKSGKSKQDAGPATPKTETVDPTVAAGQQQPTRIEAAVVARPVVAGYQTSQQQLNLPQIAFELVRQVSEGTSRFQIRLDPAELGRVDVRLDIDKSGQVTARLTVEKAETLDLMQRDQRGLEKALQQAGLDSAKTNLEFSLKQNPFSGGQQQGQDGSNRHALSNSRANAEADEAPAPTINLYRGSLSASGVNIIA